MWVGERYVMAPESCSQQHSGRRLDALDADSCVKRPGNDGRVSL
ncbi:hypothetical protein I545_2758 [Mycobacterium kansasii 662]|uniref:Uncharacterized protein n=2 Tax=Mycobacterium kansasii TaxID=1768 RepID=A0A1V3WMA1_MYCKA|nr:hypothetical protein I545_2758 [Mycobacterium kansasii 662]OOK68109.1 hypothetical protein BZL29_6833 [Mycobacterium kansasii]